MIEHRYTAEVWVAKAAPVLAILCMALVGSSCGSKAHHNNAKPQHSQDWSAVVAELTATELTDDAIEKAKKAGLRVMAETEINGDRFVELLDPVTGALVSRESIYVDRFPLPLPPANLKRPVLVYPPNATVFDGYARKTELRWQSVPGAAWYVVQVDLGWPDGPESTSWASEMGEGYKQETTTDTIFHFLANWQRTTALAPPPFTTALTRIIRENWSDDKFWCETHDVDIGRVLVQSRD